MKSDSFLSKENIIAVVGVSASPDKWGYRIYKDLKGAFQEVYAVNPKHMKIDGNECYPDLKSLPRKPDVVITVVPPEAAKGVVREAKALGVRKVWMQPGSESRESVEFCRKNGMECMFNACFVTDGFKKGSHDSGKKR